MAQFILRVVPVRIWPPRKTLLLRVFAWGLLCWSLYEFYDSFMKHGHKIFGRGYVIQSSLITWASFTLFLLAAKYGFSSQGQTKHAIYLRRFSTLADTGTLSCVFKALPTDHSLVMVVDQMGKTGSWDTFLYAVSGSRFWRSASGNPTYLTEKHEDWIDTVTQLVKDANLIIIDISEWSPSIAKEVELLFQHQHVAKTVFIREKDAPGADANQARIEELARSDKVRVIAYDRSWLAALGRLLGGALTIAALSFAIGMASFAVPFITGLLAFVTKDLYFRPGVSGASTRAIRQALAACAAGRN